MDISIDNFSGPLELLLSFVRRQKLDIVKIKILDICDQYKEFIENCQAEKQDIASEFIVMLSHLLYIKSKHLLPQEKDKQEAEELTNELEQTLIEYDILQRLAEDLNEKRSYKPFIAHPKALTPDVVDNSLSDLSLGELARLHQEIMLTLSDTEDEDAPQDKIHKITEKKRIPVSAMLEEIEYIISHKSQINFLSFIKMKKTRENKIAAFLAILEIIRKERIALKGDYLVEAAC